PRPAIGQRPSEIGTPRQVYYRPELDIWIRPDAEIAALVRESTGIIVCKNAHHTPIALNGNEVDDAIFIVRYTKRILAVSPVNPAIGGIADAVMQNRLETGFEHIAKCNIHAAPRVVHVHIIVWVHALFADETERQIGLRFFGATPYG